MRNFYWKMIADWSSKRHQWIFIWVKFFIVDEELFGSPTGAFHSDPVSRQLFCRRRHLSSMMEMQTLDDRLWQKVDRSQVTRSHDKCDTELKWLTIWSQFLLPSLQTWRLQHAVRLGVVPLVFLALNVRPVTPLRVFPQLQRVLLIFLASRNNVICGWFVSDEEAGFGRKSGAERYSRCQILVSTDWCLWLLILASLHGFLLELPLSIKWRKLWMWIFDGVFLPFLLWQVQCQLFLFSLIMWKLSLSTE